MRPPTPGSQVMATAREASKKLIGPRTHHRSISSVNALNAVGASTATSTSAETDLASLTALAFPRRAT
jgi:hypothetical protein